MMIMYDHISKMITSIVTFVRASVYYLLLTIVSLIYLFIAEFVWFAEALYPLKTGLCNDDPLYNHLGYYYAHAVLAVLHIVGINIHVNKNTIYPLEERILWISNHRSNFDGMVLAATLCAGNNSTITVSKKAVKKYPVFGSLFRHFGTIFIERQNDQTIDTLKLESTKTIEKNKSILIFPEGTTLSPKTKKDSDKYAVSQEVLPLQNLLIPRSTGFKIIKEHGKFDTIGDITIRYENPKIPGISDHSFMDLFWIFPLDIYIDTTYHHISNIDNIYQLFFNKDKEIAKPIVKNDYEIFKNYKIGIVIISEFIIAMFIYGIFEFGLSKYVMIMIMLIFLRDITF